MKLKKLTIFLILLFFSSTWLMAQTPADATTGVSVKPNFSWTESKPVGWDWSLQVSIVPSFLSTILNISLGTSQTAYNSSSTLAYNTTYYWRIYANVANSVVEPSSGSYSFTTEIATPNLIAPATTSVNPTLTWTFADGTAGVTFNIKYKLSTSSTYITEVTGLAGTRTSYTFTTQLTASTSYDFKIVANKTGEALKTSNIVTETTGAAFSLFAPGNTLTGVSIMPKFKWSTSSTSIQLTTTAGDFSSFAASTTFSSGATYTALEAVAGFPLSNNTTYYWRVSDGTNYSEVDTFKTVSNVSVSLYNPANGSKTYVYDPLMFTWYLGQAQGNTRFVLQVRKTSSPPTNWTKLSLDTYIENISNLYKTITGLKGGTRYYWRVIAYKDLDSDGSYNAGDDLTLKFSQAYYFDTQGGAVKATPSNPVGGNKIYTLTPMFGWYTMQYDASAKYRIIVATDNTTSTSTGKLNTGIVGTYPSSPTSNFYYIISSGILAYSTPYYWQVKTTYGSDVKYSAVASFVTFDNASTVVNKPVLSYPINGNKIYTSSPTLYWYGNAYGSSLTYTVSYSTTGASGSYTAWPTTTDQFLAVGPLKGGQIYHWKVKASNSTTSKTSDVESFQVAGGTSSSAIAFYPKGSVVYTTTPTLSWYREGSDIGWTKYMIKWKKSTSAPSDWETVSNFTTTNINTTIYTFSTALDYGATYYWAVALYDGTTPPVHSSYSQGSFTVYGGASSVSVVQSSPADEAFNVSLTPTVYWYVLGTSPNITSFNVEYTPYLNHTNTTSTSSTTGNYIQLTGLSSGTTYSWRVEAILGSGGPVYSGWRTFTTVATLSPVQPLAGSPMNNVQISDITPELTWYLPVQPQGSQYYDIEVANNPDFNNAKNITNVNTNSVQLQSLNNGEYYWRVKGMNTYGESYYSNNGHFRVGSVTDVSDENIIPTKFEVEQNYPNPFNPSTTIKFSLPQTEYVTIKVYNILGKEIAVLANGQFNAGAHSIIWNGKDSNGINAATGIYLYRVVAGNNIITKKMLLLK